MTSSAPCAAFFSTLSAVAATIAASAMLHPTSEPLPWLASYNPHSPLLRPHNFSPALSQIFRRISGFVLQQFFRLWPWGSQTMRACNESRPLPFPAAVYRSRPNAQPRPSRLVSESDRGSRGRGGGNLVSGTLGIVGHFLFLCTLLHLVCDLKHVAR